MFCQLLRPAAQKTHWGIWFRCSHFHLSKISLKRPQNIKSQSVHMMSECLLFLSPGDIFLASRSDLLGVSNCSKGTAVWIWFACREKKKKSHISQRQGTILNFPLSSHRWISARPRFKLFWRLSKKDHFPVSLRGWLLISLNMSWGTRTR